MSPALFTNQDAAVVELTAKLAKVTAERDRARKTAVALEQEVARVETLASEWDRQGREAEAYINRAHHTEIHEVMAEARWFPERAQELRAALGGVA